MLEKCAFCLFKVNDESAFLDVISRIILLIKYLLSPWFTKSVIWNGGLGHLIWICKAHLCFHVENLLKYFYLDLVLVQNSSGHWNLLNVGAMESGSTSFLAYVPQNWWGEEALTLWTEERADFKDAVQDKALASGMTLRWALHRTE